MNPRRPYPWRSFGGRFDPSRPRAVCPSLTLTPDDNAETYLAKISRVAQWSIERAEHLGTATWTDAHGELLRRQARMGGAASAWLWRCRNPREFGRRAFALADGLGPDRDAKVDERGNLVEASA